MLRHAQVEEVSLAKHGSEDQRERRIEEMRHAKSGPAKAAKQKAEERKAAALKARIAGAKKRVATLAPRLITLLSSGKHARSGEAGHGSAALDVEEI